MMTSYPWSTQSPPAQSGQECRVVIRQCPPEYIHSKQLTVIVWRNTNRMQGCSRADSDLEKEPVCMISNLT
ncbi:hypothetical protein PBY51_013240 [Eleginops maclovinus]|uniref:Uncharacterized protein n=1 Tax=Eleginops maclovinus TaxID=56733 RepID=A0AAN7Y6P9_ELEMC|nr:hypothetical protein PBY51_013240 [Eleginops maclovinus]